MNRNAVAVLAGKNMIDALIESSSSSSSSYDYSDEDDEANMVLALAVIPETHPRQTGYLATVTLYSDRDFWRNFRVSRKTFKYMMDYLHDNGFRNQVTFTGGLEPMTVQEILLISLQYLGNQGAIRVFADKFDRTESSVWNAIALVCKFFFNHQHDFIQWPARDEIGDVERRFRGIAGFPGAVAAIDGCHIRFHPKAEHQRAYSNYKKFCSFVLIAAVKPDRSFCYAFCGFPGSSHDTYIFQRSSLYNELENSCAEYFDSSRFHIVGDTGFPLKKWLMVPYKRNVRGGLDRAKRCYNTMLSRTRVIIEQSLGDLQNRFKRCQDIHTDIEKGVDIVIASCVINNICIQQGDMSFEGNPGLNLLNVPEIPPREGRLAAGIMKRDQLCQRLQPRNVIAFGRRRRRGGGHV